MCIVHLHNILQLQNPVQVHSDSWWLILGLGLGNICLKFSPGLYLRQQHGKFHAPKPPCNLYQMVLCTSQLEQTKPCCCYGNSVTLTTMSNIRKS